VAAYQAGDYLAAKSYLVDAAECMIELAEKAKNPDARRQHAEIAAELIDLARDAEELAGGGTKARRPAGLPGHEGTKGQTPLRSPLGKGGQGRPLPHGRGSDQRGRPGGNRQKQADEDEGPNAEDWIVRDKPKLGFDDIAGLDDVKEEIRLKMIYPFAHPELARQYGIDVGGGVLLYGPPGTGKTMLAIGLGIRACQAGHRVAFATAAEWVARLVAAHQQGRLQAEITKLGRTPLVIIDEVGYIPFEAEAANVFFQLVSARYERASLIVTSNKPFGRWGEVFGDDVVAAAMIDRLVHHAEVISLKGDSYRLRNRDLGRVPAAKTGT